MPAICLFASCCLSSLPGYLFYITPPLFGTVSVSRKLPIPLPALSQCPMSRHVHYRSRLFKPAPRPLPPRPSSARFRYRPLYMNEEGKQKMQSSIWNLLTASAATGNASSPHCSFERHEPVTVPTIRGMRSGQEGTWERESSLEAVLTVCRTRPRHTRRRLRWIRTRLRVQRRR